MVFLRNGLRIVTIAAVALALMAFLFGLPLGRYWNRLVTDSRRAWIADHRNPLLLTIAGIAGIMLLIRDPLTGRRGARDAADRRDRGRAGARARPTGRRAVAEELAPIPTRGTVSSAATRDLKFASGLRLARLARPG